MSIVKNEPQTSLSHKASEYPTSRLSAPFEPIDQSQMIAAADRMLGVVAGGKLKIIHEQIEYLKNKARDIITTAERDMQLNRVSCSFEKRAGHTYHLYERGEEDLYFSMLSPEEWGGNPPHRFIGSYKYEADCTWSEVTEP